MQKIEEANVIVGKLSDMVDGDGNYKVGGGFLIETAKSDFICPICTCEQTIKENKNPVYVQKCKGCKRKLRIYSCPFTGNLEVSEININNT